MSLENVFDMIRDAVSTERGIGILAVIALTLLALTLLGIIALADWLLRGSFRLVASGYRSLGRLLLAARTQPGEVCRAILDALDDPLAAWDGSEHELMAGGATFALGSHMNVVAIMAGRDMDMDLWSDLTPFEAATINARVKALIVQLSLDNERTRKARSLNALRTRKHRDI